MKKIILSVVALAFCAVSASAQVTGIYKGNKLVTTYHAEDADSIVFSRATEPATIKVYAKGKEIVEYNSDEADNIAYATKHDELPNIQAETVSGTIADYVDLGLPSGTLWATHNIGADTETDYGLYFAWGETTGYTSDTSDGRSFDWEHLKYCSGTTYKGPFTKYVASSDYGTVDNKTELEAADDAATVNWGSKWQMPSWTQQEELRTECTWTWDSTSKGYKVTGTNGNSIFLPAAGSRISSDLKHAGSYGIYWSCLLYPGKSSVASRLSFSSSSIDWSNDNRYYGQSVRAVRVQNNTK